MENAEKAIANTYAKTNSEIFDYTVAPVYMSENEKERISG